ncbi:MAG: NADP-dependent isocitrate dehydrogenase [Woeseia sp.]
MTTPRIIYTETDEAPALATRSLLPLVAAVTAPAGINIETRDISLAARILAAFPERLGDKQKMPDALAELGDIAKTPEANIIKLPNISASVPQLNAAVRELQTQGYDVPDFPEEPRNDEERTIRARYGAVLGSAVNPVLREGNSDRRVASAVKQFARNHPHSMGEWSKYSRTHVAHMTRGDFYASERSVVIDQPGDVKIEFVDPQSNVTVLKDRTTVNAGDIIDAAVMSCRELRSFFAREIDDAKETGILLSLHLKATMMKVSDPIMFGHAVTAYYEPVFSKHASLFYELGIEADYGIADVYDSISELPDDKRAEIEADIAAVYDQRPPLAMVDSDKGITNLHVPSNVIIDASLPAAIRSSGKMWGPDGELHDTKFIIPDRSYADIYQAVIDDCKVNGAFDPATMGNVANVGLMARKAEEYGSHDKTFELRDAGMVRVVDASGDVLLQHAVEPGDIWRLCTTGAEPVEDWVRLAVSRARATGSPAIFWLDDKRAHHLHLIEKVNACLDDLDTSGLDIRTLPPVDAMRYTLERVRAGKDTISVTGNVLRDYLTDLFPILELGTSAKMLSIVPLLAGGGLYETGAGGSAPKHVQQFLEEGHLRWDSLGEFLALAVSLQDLADKTSNDKAKLIAQALDHANAEFLENDKSPSRKVGELDTRGSHFYLVLYWAQALAEQDNDEDLQKLFNGLARELAENESAIISELNAAQGKAVDIGGYYHPDTGLADAAMRPSDTLNRIISSFNKV